MDRREFIGKCGLGIAGIISAGESPAAVVRSLVGMKQAMFNVNWNKEEEMYKQILSNTLPQDAEVELSLPAVRQSAFAYLTTLKSIVVRGVEVLNAYYLFQGSSVQEVAFPDALSNTTFTFYQCPNLRIIRMPNLKNNMNNMCYIGTSVLSDVYIDESTCAEIMSIPGFPGMTVNQNSNYANVVFHGSDGNVIYDGTAWVKHIA